jgi:uncharacterized protein YndB with AHSA1/START domain
MRKLVKSVEIAAPAARVYEFMTTPTNLPGIWPNLEAVGNVKRSADGAHSFDWTYRLVGFRFHGHSRSLEVRPNELVVNRADIGIPHTIRWTCEARGTTTRLGVELEYRIPTPVIGWIAEVLLARINERDLQRLLGNVKKALETAPRARGLVTSPAH